MAVAPSPKLQEYRVTVPPGFVAFAVNVVACPGVAGTDDSDAVGPGTITTAEGSSV